MRNFPAIFKNYCPISAVWVAVAGAILATLLGGAAAPLHAQEDPLEQPGISVPACVDNGISMFWHTENYGEATPPDGWKVERRYSTPDGMVSETFRFIGADADALQTVRDGYWDWVDTSARQHVDYIYRVRAINSDGTDMEGRAWSREAIVICLPGPLNRPGISIPWRQYNGVAIFWHTENRGSAKAPGGWKVERRHWDSGGWVVKTFTFICGEADALQTFNDEYWDWLDSSADLNVDYTYRVRAINADGSDMEDRDWSRRAPVEG